MDAGERAAAADEIRNVKARYCRGVDQKDPVLLRGVFAADAVADYSGALTDPVTGQSTRPDAVAEPVRGGDAIVAGIMRATRGNVTVHHLSPGEIEIDGPDAARAVWPMVDRLLRPASDPVREVVGYGYYFETYGRENGRWVIKTISMSRLRVDIHQRETAPA